MRQLLITGASRGIGRSLAEAAVNEGYQVVGLARSFNGDEPFEKLCCDVRDVDQVETTLDRFKGNKDFYGVINAAGVLKTSALIQADNLDIANIINTNLLGTIYVCKKVARLLLPLRRGRIINISSIAAHLALKGDSVYSASKGGVETFSRSLSREISKRNITVNCIAPGPIPTDMISHLTQEQVDALLDQQIIQRQIEIHELWPVVKLLLSDDSAVITGDVIHIGGV